MCAIYLLVLEKGILSFLDCKLHFMTFIDFVLPRSSSSLRVSCLSIACLSHAIFTRMLTSPQSPASRVRKNSSFLRSFSSVAEGGLQVASLWLAVSHWVLIILVSREAWFFCEYIMAPKRWKSQPWCLFSILTRDDWCLEALIVCFWGGSCGDLAAFYTYCCCYLKTV